MNINFSAWAIRNPSPVVLLFVLLTAAGLMAFAAMKVQNFPDIELPVVTVSASLPGASPSQMETEVARRLENALATVPGVKRVNSTLTDGAADLSVEFQLEKPVQQALDGVRDAVARVRGDLPADLRDPVIRKVELSDAPVLTFTVTSTRHTTAALSWFVDNEVGRTLLAVPGVGAVRRIGGVDREVRVDLDPHRLLALNATAADISRQLRRAQQESSGGRAELGGAEQSVRTLATVPTAAALAALELTLADGRRLRLDQVATVSDGVAPPRSAALLDGAPVVAFEVQRARGHGEMEVADGVRRAVAALQQHHAGLVLTESLNFIDPVVENYEGSMRLLYEGAALAVLVVFLFLRDGRATFVAAVALPLSVIPTFALMHALGFTLNIVTLLSLSLSLVVGVLVDDAIVEIENIERHLLMGKGPVEAARDAAAEIGLAVIATTFTLVAVFLPTAFMSGTVGRFFVQFGWTAAGAVLFSLLVARLLTPMMAAYLLRAPAHRGVAEPAWVLRYLRWARTCLRHRGLTLVAATAFFAGGLALAALLPSTFIPVDDEARTEVVLTLPPGSRLADTVALAEQARLLVMHHGEVRRVLTAIGTEVRTARLTLTLSHRSERRLSQQAVEQQLRDALAALPGVRVQVGDAGEGYVLVLAGDDERLLNQHAQRVTRDLRTLPGVGGVTSSASLSRPELQVRPDFARAAELGVSAEAIADTLRVATLGDYAQALPKLNLSERQVPITVRLDAAGRASLDVLRRLPVPGARGPVALENVATLAMDSGPVQIDRQDRRRIVRIEVESGGRPLGDIEAAVATLPSLQRLPAGIQRSTQGDADEMDKLARGFGLAMLTGVLCIYIVLALLLKDFAQPGTVLVALVLSVPGAMLALFLTGAALSMPSMIGLIMLMGIATKNAILLVDYVVIARRDQGLDRAAAILDACRKRARPIVMTTLAMGAGMLPVALGWVGDPSFRVPMAIVVIGGLITSTFLSLLVVPVVYSVVDDGVARLLPLLGRGAPVAPAAR
jgi:multidrug efflux pump subunit AcrB